MKTTSALISVLLLLAGCVLTPQRQATPSYEQTVAAVSPLVGVWRAENGTIIALQAENVSAMQTPQGTVEGFWTDTHSILCMIAPNGGSAEAVCWHYRLNADALNLEGQVFRRVSRALH